MNFNSYGQWFKYFCKRTLVVIIAIVTLGPIGWVVYWMFTGKNPFDGYVCPLSDWAERE